MKNRPEEVKNVTNKKEISRILKIVDEDPSIKNPEEHYSEFQFRIVVYSNAASTRGSQFKVKSIREREIPGSGGKRGYRAFFRTVMYDEFFFFQANNVLSVEIKKIYEYCHDQGSEKSRKPKKRLLTFFFND